MILTNKYSGLCSDCKRPTILEPLGYCQNVRRDGSPCHIGMPSYNSTFRRKWNDHTKPWNGRNVDSHSWVTKSGLYIESFQQVCRYGSLFYDLAHQQPFLIVTPSGDQCFANVMDTSTGIITGASGIIQPLNQKLVNLHPHFGNSEPWYLAIASAPLMIEIPDRKTSYDLVAYKNGQHILSYNLITKTPTIR